MKRSRQEFPPGEIDNAMARPSRPGRKTEPRRATLAGKADKASAGYHLPAERNMKSPDKDKIFEKVINPYLAGVLQHPQSIEMHEGMLHICDLEGPKKTRSMEERLEAMEQQVFKCQGMVERGLNTNHMMIMEFTSKHKIDANDIGKHLSRLYDRIDHLQAQIYDLENQNCEYEYRFKSIGLAADLRIPETPSSFHDGARMPWKTED
ncbi:40S ribosomal protein S5-1 [Hordeum vulgare]|nr:40S ribosomal protein S5-1 [Hordeum vulgare]